MSNVPMTLPELMLAEHDTSYGHSSTFAELDDGRILHVAAAWKNYSEDGGLTWRLQYQGAAGRQLVDVAMLDIGIWELGSDLGCASWRGRAPSTLPNWWVTARQPRPSTTIRPP